MSMLSVSRFARRKQAAPVPRIRAPENVQWLLQEAQAPPAKRPMYHSKVWPLGVVAPLPAGWCSVRRSTAPLVLAAPQRRAQQSCLRRSLAVQALLRLEWLVTPHRLSPPCRCAALCNMEGCASQHCGAVGVGHFEMGVRRSRAGATFGRAHGEYAPRTAAYQRSHSQAPLPARALSAMLSTSCVTCTRQARQGRAQQCPHLSSAAPIKPSHHGHWQHALHACG